MYSVHQINYSAELIKTLQERSFNLYDICYIQTTPLIIDGSSKVRRGISIFWVKKAPTNSDCWQKIHNVLSKQIVFLTGSVYSRSPWDVFNAIFGNNEDTSEENSITFDDETSHASNRKLENSVDKSVGGEESNEIPGGVDSYTQQNKEEHMDNRVGDLDQVKGDRSEERFRRLLKKYEDYAKNLSGLDKGPQYWDILDNDFPTLTYHVDFDDGFWYDNSDDSDPSYSDDSDYEWFHDEFK